MLRLAPTKIGIGSKDLTWHSERHAARQNLRNNGLQVEFIGSPVKPFLETPERLKVAIPHRFLHSPSTKMPDISNNTDEAFVFTESTAQDPKSFYKTFTGEATRPSEILVQNVGRRPRIVEQSCDSQGMTRSSKASIEEDYSDSPEDHVNHSEDTQIQISDDGSETISRLEYSMFPDPQSSSEANEESEEVPTGDNFLEGSLQFVLPIRSSSRLSYNERFHRSPKLEQHSMELSQPPNLIELDGTSDPSSDPQKDCCAVVEVDFDYDISHNHLYMPGIGGPGLIGRSSRAESASIIDESVNQSPSPQVPLPRTVDNIRRRCSGLPRSPLYMSQAAASSSPEKRPYPSTNSDDDCIDDAYGPLSQSSRRRSHKTTYISRSDNYPYSSSEASLPSTRPDSVERLSIEEPLQKTLSTYPQSSSTELNNYYHQEPITLSPNPRLNSSPASSHHTESPYTLPSLPSHRRRRPNASVLPSPLPPYPFSATPRTVSFNLVNSSSPRSPPPSPPATTPYSTPSPTPRRLAVYNDRLPAASQPQTPARLPRNGLPAMSAQMPGSAGSGIGIMVQTAPVGNRRSRANSQRVTPTRRRMMESEDQENWGLVGEAGRRLARRAERRDLLGEDDDEEEDEGW